MDAADGVFREPRTGCATQDVPLKAALRVPQGEPALHFN